MKWLLAIVVGLAIAAVVLFVFWIIARLVRKLVEERSNASIIIGSALVIIAVGASLSGWYIPNLFIAPPTVASIFWALGEVYELKGQASRQQWMRILSIFSAFGVGGYLYYHPDLNLNISILDLLCFATLVLTSGLQKKETPES